MALNHCLLTHYQMLEFALLLNSLPHYQVENDLIPQYFICSILRASLDNIKLPPIQYELSLIRS